MFRRKKIRMELIRQERTLRDHYPEFTTQLRGFRGGTQSLIVTGRVRPTSMTNEYSVRIEYDGVSRPRFLVAEPQLAPREEGRKIPHTWTPNEPCLYFKEWKVGLSLADTIVPWGMLWLTFYESWRVTGEWQGGGVEHGPPGDRS